MEDNKNKKTTNTKVDSNKKEKTTKKPVPKNKTVNNNETKYKNDIKKLKEQIKNLKEKNINLESENQKNIIEFQMLAKNFQSKAQEQINAKKNEVSEKLEEEKKNLKKYGSQKLLESIIEPILNIEQAVIAGKSQEAVSAYVMGFEMLLNQLYQELESFGVNVIYPKVGEEFNPELHYVMSQVDGGETNTIKEIKKKGFKLHDRVLKPATVITFK